MILYWLAQSLPQLRSEWFCPLLAVWLVITGFSSGKRQWKKHRSIVYSAYGVFKVSICGLLLAEILLFQAMPI